RLYNGLPAQRVSTSEGATSHSVEAARMGIITRGVLVDAPMLRDVECIQRGDGVGLDDVAKAEEKCGFTVGEGDVLLLRTGQLGQREKTGPVDPHRGGSSGPLPELL